MALIIFIILILFVLLSMIYPLWIKMLGKKIQFKYKVGNHPNNVTLVYLSFNGFDYIKQKIDFLLNELNQFDQFEILIIDDCSTDETIPFLKDLQHNHIKVFFKDTQKGIPDSMNLAIRNAQYEYVIFCDQRQTLTEEILRKIVNPLSNEEVGAVSSKLSPFDKNKRISPIRIYENYLKKQESHLGKLIGVYGPLYALKKEYFSPIPENIILDDLYVTLQILPFKKVILIEDACIIDEDAAMLYNYKRIKRYLLGLIQLLFQKNIIKTLPNQEKWMLFWHKYFKLSVPLVLFLCNIALGVLACLDSSYLFLFLGINLWGLLTLVLHKYFTKFHYQSLLCINILYIVGLFDVILNYKTYKFHHFNNKK